MCRLHFSISLDWLGIFRYIWYKNIHYVINRLKSNANFTFFASFILSSHICHSIIFLEIVKYIENSKRFISFHIRYNGCFDCSTMSMVLNYWSNRIVLFCWCFDMSFCTVLYYNISRTTVLFLTLMTSVLHWNLLNCWIDFNCTLEQNCFISSVM